MVSASSIKKIFPVYKANNNFQQNFNNSKCDGKKIIYKSIPGCTLWLTKGAFALFLTLYLANEVFLIIFLYTFLNLLPIITKIFAYGSCDKIHIREKLYYYINFIINFHG